MGLGKGLRAALAAMVLLAHPGAAQTAPSAELPFVLKEIGPGVYAAISPESNAGFIVGDDAVLVDRTHIVAWVDMEAMSKATIATAVAPLTVAGVNGYVPGVPDPEEPEPPPNPLAGIHPAALADPNAAPGGPKDAAQGKGPPEGKDSQGKAPKEALSDRDQRRLGEAWQRAYRARRAQALRELPERELIDA